MTPERPSTTRGVGTGPSVAGRACGGRDPPADGDGAMVRSARNRRRG
jgi:hypothetical protein